MNSRQLYWLMLISAACLGLPDSISAGPFEDSAAVTDWMSPAVSPLVLVAKKQSVDRHSDSVLGRVELGDLEVETDRPDDSRVALTDYGAASDSGHQSDDRCPQWYPHMLSLSGGDPSLRGVAPISAVGQPYGVLAFVNYDAFRGVPDGAWGNYGITTGFNYATRLGQFSEMTGIGLQAGGSIGVYNWAGTDYRAQNQGGAETQGFFTYGLYRKPTETSRITAALVQDWSVNDNFSEFGQSPTLSQLRWQLGYAVDASNTFGAWGTAHVMNSTHQVAGFGPVTWQPINQLSGYWHHKWQACGPDTWISAGVPLGSPLSGGGTLGDYLVSATANAPFNDSVSLFTNITYMHQAAGQGGLAAREDAWNLTIGISIYPQRNSRNKSVAGERWMPLLPVANNGSFLVDSSRSF